EAPAQIALVKAGDTIEPGGTVPIAATVAETIARDTGLVSSPKELASAREAVAISRAEAEALLRRQAEAQVNVAKSGTSEDLAAARPALLGAKQAVVESQSRLTAALVANDAANAKAVLAEQQRLYGPAGPTVPDHLGAGLGAAAGLVTGTAEGAVTGAV